MIQPKSSPGVRFSVVIPTYNRADTLPRAIGSVLTQSYENFELVIVDDGSVDATRDVVGAFDDQRVTYLPQANRGVSAARNAGAKAAQGDFLVFLDSDDELVPDALHRFSVACAEHDLVVSGVIKVSPDGRRWRTVTPNRDRVLVTRFSPLLAAGFAIRTSLFLDCGGYDETLTYSENTELGWRLRAPLAHEHSIEVIESPLAIVYNRSERGHDQSRYDAALRILELRSYELEGDGGNSSAQRTSRGNYLAIAAFSAARIGRRREALTLAARAVATDPAAPSRYRTAAGVARAVLLGRRAPTGTNVQPPPTVHLEATETSSTVHALLVTYERPDLLRRTIAQLPVADLASLTIVDNAPSPESRDAAGSADELLCSVYVGMPENAGPAGALAAGVERILERCSDDDWLLVLNDDGGLAGPADAVERLHDFGDWLIDHGGMVGAVGLTGARFDLRTGTLRRPDDRELFGPVTVDYVAGNQLLMIRAGAARAAGNFDPGLFFGFEELDYCTRIRRAGFGIFVDGPLAREARDRHGRLGDDVGPVDRTTNPWRRYYSVRNRIVLMRRYSTRRRAIATTMRELFGRPIADLRKRRAQRFQLAAAGTRACVDAWLGRLGRRVEPTSD